MSIFKRLFRHKAPRDDDANAFLPPGWGGYNSPFDDYLRNEVDQIEEKESSQSLPSSLKRKMALGHWGNPVLRAVLLGTSDPGSPLHLLRGKSDILKIIFADVADLWRCHLAYPKPISGQGHPAQPFARLDRVEFPKPQDIQINMMPFIYGRKTSLPKELWPYWTMILKHCYSQRLRDKVCYLTIHESMVEAGESQRRPGLHTDSPGKLKLGGLGKKSWQFIDWGGGTGGIYLASNVENSCAVWPIRVKRLDSVAGRNGHGDLEHMRGVLPRPVVMEPNRMYWISDHTPHESLPVEERTYRQFFRLVTDQVSVWFSRHSTPNPTGVMPDCQIVSWDKFSEDRARISTKSNDEADDFFEDEEWSDMSASESDDALNQKEHFENVNPDDQLASSTRKWTVDRAWRKHRKLIDARHFEERAAA